MINISKLVDIFTGWILVLQEFWDIFNRNLTSFIFPSSSSSFSVNLVIKFLDATGLADLTLLEFMLGAGLFLYLGYQLIIWILNLIT